MLQVVCTTTRVPTRSRSGRAVRSSPSPASSVYPYKSSPSGRSDAATTTLTSWTSIYRKCGQVDLAVSIVDCLRMMMYMRERARMHDDLVMYIRERSRAWWCTCVNVQHNDNVGSCLIVWWVWWYQSKYHESMRFEFLGIMWIQVWLHKHHDCTCMSLQRTVLCNINSFTDRDLLNCYIHKVVCMYIFYMLLMVTCSFAKKIVSPMVTNRYWLGGGGQ